VWAETCALTDGTQELFDEDGGEMPYGSCTRQHQLRWRSGVNQLAAQASKALADTTARVLIPAGTLRCAAGVAGCRLAGHVPPAGLAAAARVRRDMAVIQVLARRPW
jgi:hypothetical protein